MRVLVALFAALALAPAAALTLPDARIGETLPSVDPPVDVDALVGPPLEQPLPDAGITVEGVALPLDASVALQLQPRQAGPQADAAPAVPRARTSVAADAAVATAVVATTAAGSLGVLAHALGAHAAAAWSAVRRAGRFAATLLPAGLLPLFSRIEAGQVLENPVRQRVHAAIQSDPGASIATIQQRSNVAWGTAVFHLQRLERHGLVVSVRQGGSRRYYPANSDAARRRDALAALAHPTTRRVADYVRANAGTDQAGLCRAVGLLNPAASKQLTRLEALGLVLSRREGRSRLYWPTEPLEASLMLLSPSAPAAAQEPYTSPTHAAGAASTSAAAGSPMPLAMAGHEVSV